MNMCCTVLIIIILEVLLTIFYTIISPKKDNSKRFDVKSIVKGLVERAFLTYSLINNFPHALTLFGALKLGTRLKSADDEKTEEGIKKESKYNDYFLIGNFVSVTLSIIYYNLLK
jgi:hypothetical protein